VREAVGPSIDVPVAFAAWFSALFVGQLLLGGLVFAAFGVTDGDYTIPQFAIAALAGWSAFVIALWIVSTRFATGDVVNDLAIGFSPRDVIGVPLGIAGQLLLVPAVYIPLQAAWPDAFDTSDLERRARELVDKADTGLDTALLGLIVVVGAPLVEELVYRGLLQRSVAARLGRWPAAVLIAALFSLIHLSPVEYPGLFVAGLLFGGCLAVTGRLGASILTHAAFNATGFVVVMWF
jgi:uncharacterized protein